MSGDSIPDDVRHFILSYIESIAQLEAMLLLHRESEGSWDVAAVGRRLYIPTEAAADVLARLRSDGFIETPAKPAAFIAGRQNWSVWWNGWPMSTAGS